MVVWEEINLMGRDTLNRYDTPNQTFYKVNGISPGLADLVF